MPMILIIFEAHGTGTALGDPIEVNALKHVFGAGRQEALVIGTVKTNIGHLEAASGIAGVIKTILSLQHEEIPRHLHFRERNPQIEDFANIPAQLPLTPISWQKRANHPRRAGVSSFGFSGTNAHVIIEEAPEQDLSQVKQALARTVFNRQRYWAPALEHAVKRGLFGADVHPLLGARMPEIVNQTAIIYEQRLDLSETSLYYLADHKVFHHILYPGAGFVELLLSAICDVHPGEAIQLKDISIERPLECSGIKKLQVLIEGDFICVYSQEEERDWRLHAQGYFSLGAESFAGEGLKVLRRRINEEVDVVDFYAHMQVFGLQYGEQFQTVRRAWTSGAEVLVELEAHTEDSRYGIYPPLFDGALQALDLLAPEKMIYLPVSFATISYYAPLTQTAVAHVKLTERNAQWLTADIDIYQDDTLCLHVTGFKAHQANKVALERLLQHEGVQTWSYEQVWNLYTPEIATTALEHVVTYDARSSDASITLAPAQQLLEFIQHTLKEHPVLSRLNILTENAYCIANEENRLNQSQLNGLIKTIILEHPELAIRQIDLEAGEDISFLTEIHQEVGTEQILVHRDNKWYAPRIVPELGLSVPLGEYRVVKNENGVLEALTVIEEEVYTPKANEVVIASRAVGLNFRDVLNAMNLYPGEAGALGGDVAGVVQAIGADVRRFKVGDVVLGLAEGSLSSQAVSREELLITKPELLNDAQACTLPTVFMTAYLALIKLAQLKEGEWVLIHAGTGGVGLAAIQIAQYVNARVIATAGNEKKRAYLKALGVEHVFDSRSTAYQMEILHITENRGVDVVLNSLTGKGFIDASLKCCAPGARFVEIGKRDIWSPQDVAQQREDIDYHILALDVLAQEHPEEIHVLLTQVLDLFIQGHLRPIPQTEFNLSQAVDAFKYLQQAHQIGKVVITLPPAHICFDAQASYLITGGLGGIGLELARYLSEHGAGRVVLSSRRAVDESDISTISVRDTLIEIQRCDVSDKPQVQQLIRMSHTPTYPLKGIFHLVGVVDDAPIDKQSAERFDKVFLPKALGAWHLHEVTQEEEITLDYFVLFSSIASLNGSPGQSNYATANSFLDGLAYYRHHLGLKAQSLNWGPWREVGMAKHWVASHERQGAKPLKTADALAALSHALREEKAQLEIIHANWKLISESLSQVPTWLSELMEKKAASVFMQILAETPVEQRESLLKAAIVQEIRKVLNLSSTQMIDETKGFFEMGMDSLMALELRNRLQALIDVSLSNTLAFDYPTLTTLVPYLNGILSLTELKIIRQEVVRYVSPQEPIAIIGIGCRFPGGAEGPEQFWSLLQEGLDSSIEVPKERWNIDAYYDPNPDAPGKMISRKSSFLTSSIADFDAEFFGISPREAEYLDPQQRLLLEVTWEALEDAGIEPKALNSSLSGVFIGLSSHDYEDLLTQALNVEEIDAYLGTGNAASTATGRISYTLGLQGPSMAIDTACSSSLVALHQACQSLRLGESNLAIAGGVNVLLSPALSINFSQAHMLAPDGHCKTFDASADGYVRGEGCGIVILKRLSDAQRDYDRILAIISGSAVNQDGASSGLTVPNGPSQEVVIKRALEQAQLNPGDIDYVEAHGTGTALGDPIEVNALKNVFGESRQKALVIGTVKTNIGHLEAASGIAGVIKTILSLQHEEIPKHLHFRERNPQIVDFAQIPAQLPLNPISWQKQDNHPRRAGISSFGFSGTNAHVVIEEAPEQDLSQIRQPLASTVFNRQRYWAKCLESKIMHYQLLLPTTGSLSDLQVSPYIPPSLGEEEILIRVGATGVNFRDLLAVLHLYQGLQGAVGLECSGRVIARGEGVTRWQIGDEVFGIALSSYADVVVAHEQSFALRPQWISIEEAAALPIAYLTAYTGLIKLAEAKAGEKVLIHAAAGGVGLAAVQIAQYLGATIYATAGSEEKHAYLRSLGITHIYHSRNRSFSEQIMQDTQGAGVDVVLNSLTQEGFIDASVNCCAQGARFVEIGRLNIWRPEEMAAVRSDIIYYVMQLDNTILNQPKAIGEILSWLVECLGRKELHVLPITAFPFGSMQKGFAYLEQAQNIGKVVITSPPSVMTEREVRNLLGAKVLTDKTVLSLEDKD
ncbi:MAG: SDR family NAD(P)-dependent oxidoreductase, partial [Gammaproteobacteria bacterium]